VESEGDVGGIICHLAGDGREIGCWVRRVTNVAIDKELCPEDTIIFTLPGNRCSDRRFAGTRIPCQPKEALSIAGDVMYHRLMSARTSIQVSESQGRFP